MAFAGLLLGMLAAVGAQKLDPKVYIAADVEEVLGCLPFAILPDFDEVTDGVAEEHLLRLSSGIEYAYQQGGLKNCMFTGAGPGVALPAWPSACDRCLRRWGGAPCWWMLPARRRRLSRPVPRQAGCGMAIWRRNEAAVPARLRSNWLKRLSPAT